MRGRCVSSLHPHIQVLKLNQTITQVYVPKTTLHFFSVCCVLHDVFMVLTSAAATRKRQRNFFGPSSAEASVCALTQSQDFPVEMSAQTWTLCSGLVCSEHWQHISTSHRTGFTESFTVYNVPLQLCGVIQLLLVQSGPCFFSKFQLHCSSELPRVLLSWSYPPPPPAVLPTRDQSWAQSQCPP